jgi:hypothetical protein
VSALFGLAPLTLLFGLLAQWTTLTSATLWVSLIALGFMVFATRKAPVAGHERQ